MDPIFIIFAALVIGAAVLAVVGISAQKSAASVDLREKLKTLTNNPDGATREIELGIEEKRKNKVDQQSRNFFQKFTGKSYLENLDRELVQCDIPLKTGEFLLLRVVVVILAFAITFWYFGNIFYGLGAGLLALFIHIPVMKIMRSLRITKFVNQLAEFLVLITNSLRAGQTFLQGVDVASKESPNPIGIEFRQLLKETNLGIPVEEAFDNMLQRVPNEDLKIVMSAFSIQRQVGGNLADIMEQVAAMIRQRIQIQGQIKVLTTQGKLSGAIVGLLPFGLGTIIAMINYGYMSRLWTISPIPNIGMTGPILLAVGIFMQLLGCFVIYKICDIEV
ncbi:MAG: type II secretion system F family protein [Verrucomicrobiota bacterium]